MRICPSVAAHGILAGLLLTSFLTGCVSLEPRPATRNGNHAFIEYWPPAEGSQGLRLAVKDLIDMKGVVTTAGSKYLAESGTPATQDAACMAIARERGVQIVGKTNLTEFAVTVSGKNRYFGTPVNKLDGRHKFIPGGSSSGSAVAVASGMADVAFGTDSGGSIRVPAACTGIMGLKTTFGLISTKGVFPISPKHLDTIGPMAKDMPRLVQGMDLLQRGFAGRYQRAVAAKPSARQITLGRLYLDGTDPVIEKALDDALAAKNFKVVRLDDDFKAKWLQAEKDGTTIAFADAWVHDKEFLDKPDVAGSTKAVVNFGSVNYPQNYQEAVRRKSAWQRDLRRALAKVDFIALPTMKQLPPRIPLFVRSVVFELLVFDMQNTIAVNFAGNPALAIPIPLPDAKPGRDIPVTSLQLIGPRLSEAELLNAGRLIDSRP
ncbi:MAG: amidase [Chthoniobacterales bacterium]